MPHRLLRNCPPVPFAQWGTAPHTIPEKFPEHPLQFPGSRSVPPYGFPRQIHNKAPAHNEAPPMGYRHFPDTSSH